jgi:hypothetical protein
MNSAVLCQIFVETILPQTWKENHIYDVDVSVESWTDMTVIPSPPLQTVDK